MSREEPDARALSPEALAAALARVRAAFPEEHDAILAEASRRITAAARVCESIGEAVITIDGAGQIMHANAAAGRLLERDPASLVGASVHGLLHPNEGRGAPCGLASALDRGAERVEERFARADGSSAQVVMTVGLVAEGAVLVARDHDALARADALREQQARALEGAVSRAINEVAERKRAEERFRRLIEGAPDAVLIVDARGAVVLVNAQTETMFGYARRELVGHNVDALLPERFRSTLAGDRAVFYADAQVRPTVWGRELIAARRDGSEFPIEMRISALEVDGGLLLSIAVRDVTDRKRAEEERLTSVARLKEIERLKDLDQFKSQFLNTAAHELGTPLTPIMLQLHMLKASYVGELTQDQKRAIGIVDRNIERLSQIVTDLLDVARLQSGRLKITVAEADLERVLVECVESFQDPALRAGVTIETRVPPGLEVSVDARRISQVVFNLVSNALKFTPSGGRVVVEARRDGHEIAVHVADTGAGLKPEDIPRLFQPFSQVHDPMQLTVPGTGLGLFISKGIVDLHGGRMWCESGGPGKGTRFSFTVPMRPPAVRSSDLAQRFGESARAGAP